MQQLDGHIADRRGILKSKAWKPYRYSFVVYAQQMSEDFEIVTDDGSLIKGRAGDYLVWGPNGNKWPLTKERFDANYESL